MQGRKPTACCHPVSHLKGLLPPSVPAGACHPSHPHNLWTQRVSWTATRYFFKNAFILRGAAASGSCLCRPAFPRAHGDMHSRKRPCFLHFSVHPSMRSGQGSSSFTFMLLNTQPSTQARGRCGSGDEYFRIPSLPHLLQ